MSRRGRPSRRVALAGPRDACAWCRGGIPTTARADAKFCGKRCRQAHWRFARFVSPAAAARRFDEPLRLAYADPPYPGKAHYYRGHRDYAGEVDHAELLSRLQEYDGWALSTSSGALGDVLALCREHEQEVRVAAWVKGPRPGKSAWPRQSWEPVVFAGGRRVASRATCDDSLVHGITARRSDPAYVIGAKPAAFCAWLFALLGARAGDELDDLYPGSGGVGRAWALYTRRASTTGDASRGDRAATDVSRPTSHGAGATDERAAA